MDRREITVVVLLGIVAAAAIPVSDLATELFPAWKLGILIGCIGLIFACMVAIAIILVRDPGPPPDLVLTDLSKLSRNQLKAQVAALVREFRGIDEDVEARNVQGWGLNAFSQEAENHRYNTRANMEIKWRKVHPTAVAVLKELRRRVGDDIGKMSENGKHGLHTIDYDSLAGPSPVRGAAAGLEELARLLR